MLLTRETTREIDSSIPRRKGNAAVLTTKWFCKHIPIGEFNDIPDGVKQFGRRWPFRKVEFDWPDEVELSKPIDFFAAPVLDQTNDPIENGCWLYAKGKNDKLLVSTRTTDRQGKTQEFSTPIMLIAPSVAKAGGDQLKRVLNMYLSLIHI